MTTDRKPGDTWRVRVGNQVFDAVVDPHGVHRFRQNAIIRDLYDAARRVGLDMNSIVVALHTGKYSVEDVRELDALLGYSHDGFLELSYNAYADEMPKGAIPVDVVDIPEGADNLDYLAVVTVQGELAAISRELEGAALAENDDAKLARVGRITSRMRSLYAEVPSLVRDHLDLMDQHLALLDVLQSEEESTTTVDHIREAWAERLKIRRSARRSV